MGDLSLSGVFARLLWVRDKARHDGPEFPDGFEDDTPARKTAYYEAGAQFAEAIEVHEEAQGTPTALSILEMQQRIVHFAQRKLWDHIVGSTPEERVDIVHDKLERMAKSVNMLLKEYREAEKQTEAWWRGQQRTDQADIVIREITNWPEKDRQMFWDKLEVEVPRRKLRVVKK